jgi:hypothetical protein
MSNVPTTPEGQAEFDKIVSDNLKLGDWGDPKVDLAFDVGKEDFTSPGEALEHFGTNGMKWGVRKSDIDDKLRKANKAKLKEYKKNGNDWIDRELYDK